MSVPDESTGNLIALEGDVNCITTQLRLLPPSSKILTLPSLSSALSKSIGDEKFIARNYVRQVHETFTQRCDQARSFLRSSTGAQPRLVFMNGGCVSARTACITKISEELAEGDIVEGERIFNQIVERGVAGLYESDMESEFELETTLETEASATPRPEDNQEPESELPIDEPVEAKVLVHSPEQTTRRINGSIDSEKFFDAHSSAHEFPRVHRESVSASDLIFSPKIDYPFHPEGEIPVNAQSTDTKPDETRNSFEKRTSFGSYTSDQLDEELGETDFEEAEEHQENEEVVYGEACVVAVNQGSNGGAQRFQSQDMLRLFTTAPYLSPYGALRRVRSHELTRPRPTLPAKRGSSLENLPRTVYVRRTSNPKSPKAVYVDQGCDPLVEEQPAVEVPFQPVFPLVEDLIIHFLDGNVYEVFDFVLKSYKNGSYPRFPIKADDQRSVPNSPTSADRRRGSVVTVETDDEGQQQRHEINPYSTTFSQHSSSNQAPSPRKVSSKNVPHMLSVQSPPTPAPTPPLTRYSSTRFERFVEFSPINIKTALGIQNSFRSLLAQRFPTALGYKQLSYPSESDRFWKPVFRNDEGYQNEGRTVDQILAVGYAERVNRDLFHTVSGQIEGLGVKRSGLRKSATIDIRYLVSTCLQSIAQQSPTDERAANPMAYPAILAELLVPHLESYLAGNELTRLLVMKYDPAMLPTVLELRRIIGEDAFKVAGIVDSASDVRPALNQPNLLSNEGTSMLNARSRFSGSNRFANTTSSHRNSAIPPKRTEELLPKSNFLLSSTATEKEIFGFIESIRKVLIVKNSFFEPEPAPIVRPPTPPPEPVVVSQPRTRTPSRSRTRTVEREVSRPTTATPYDPWEGFCDSEDDEIDRMFMPTLPRRVQRKGNSRKALKWLGLA